MRNVLKCMQKKYQFLYAASTKSSEAYYGIVLSVCLSVTNVKAYFSETTQVIKMKHFVGFKFQRYWTTEKGSPPSSPLKLDKLGNL